MGGSVVQEARYLASTDPQLMILEHDNVGCDSACPCKAYWYAINRANGLNW